MKHPDNIKIHAKIGAILYTLLSNSFLSFFLLFFYIFIFIECSRPGNEAHPESPDKLITAKPEEAGMTGTTLESIAAELESKVAEGYMTAAQVLVAREGKIVLHKAFGRMSPEAGAPSVTDASPFLVASITKPFTAAAVMMCADRGFIDIDKPVKTYIPEFTGGGRDRITVWNLLNHTSGLPDMLPENEALRKSNTPPKDFIPRVITTPLLFTPGTQVKYQSMGINLLGEITERVTEMPLREFMRREIFEPLGLANTFLGMGGRNLEDLVQCDVAEAPGDPGYERWDWNSPYWRDFGAPWGGLHSTARDIAVFLQTFLNGGEHGGKRILRQETAHEMITNQAEGLNSPWGLGWGFRDSLDWTYFGTRVSPETFGHCGATGTVAWADPVHKVLFVCLTTRPLDEHKGELFNRLSDLVVEAME